MRPPTAPGPASAACPPAVARDAGHGACRADRHGRRTTGVTGGDEMDSYGDMVGLLVVVAMIWVGWTVALAAWREGTTSPSDPVVDLRGTPGRDPGH